MSEISDFVIDIVSIFSNELAYGFGISIFGAISSKLVAIARVKNES